MESARRELAKQKGEDALKVLFSLHPLCLYAFLLFKPSALLSRVDILPLLA